MNTERLQTIVTVEATILALVCLIILFSFKRWKIPLCAAGVGATAALFYAWTPLLAFGSLLVYGPASMLLWQELNNKVVKHVSATTRKIQFVAWSLVAIGVIIIIVKNVSSILMYLG